MEHLREVLRGIRSVWASLAPRPYPDYTGFEADAKAMRTDFGIVAQDMRTALRKADVPAPRRRVKGRGHGKRVNAR